MFFWGSNTASNIKRLLKKKLKKLKKKQHEAFCRRQHIIIEARKAHEHNRKTIKKSKGGWGSTSTMEQESLGFAVMEGINKGVQKGSIAMARFKARKKSINKSRKTHLDKLKKSRENMKKRQR